jgi:AraC family transcriptional regulator
VSRGPFGRPVVLETLDLDPARVSIRYESIDQDVFISYVAEQILNEFGRETSTGRLLIESLGHSLSAHLVHRYSATSLRLRTAPDGAPKPLDNKRLSRVAEFIRTHIEEEFTVADLSQIACMSVAHFSRSFKAATGRAPHEYVSGERLELAKRLLLASDRSLLDIAFSTGFSSQANFNRAFRRSVGTTPGAYRIRPPKA